MKHFLLTYDLPPITHNGRKPVAIIGGVEGFVGWEVQKNVFTRIKGRV